MLTRAWFATSSEQTVGETVAEETGEGEGEGEDISRSGLEKMGRLGQVLGAGGDKCEARRRRLGTQALLYQNCPAIGEWTRRAQRQGESNHNQAMERFDNWARPATNCGESHADNAPANPGRG